MAGALAVGTGLTYLVTAVLLIRATSPIKIWPIHLGDILGIVAFGAKLTSTLSIPVGVAFVVGGILTLRAARAPNGLKAAQNQGDTRLA